MKWEVVWYLSNLFNFEKQISLNLLETAAKKEGEEGFKQNAKGMEISS